MMNNILLQKTTLLKRVYEKKDVSGLTLAEINTHIQDEGIDYSGDFGLEMNAYNDVELVYSLN